MNGRRNIFTRGRRGPTAGRVTVGSAEVSVVISRRQVCTCAHDDFYLQVVNLETQDQHRTLLSLIIT